MMCVCAASFFVMFRVIFLLLLSAVLSSERLGDYDKRRRMKRASDSFCIRKCSEKATILTGACAAVGVFFGASVCTIPFINVKDPLICGMIEAPFNGLAAFCKDDRFLDRICDDCKKTGFFDMFYSTKFVKYRITQIVKPIDKALQNIQDYSQKTVKKVTEAVSNLQFTIKDLKLTRYDQLLSRIRFLAFMFGRIDFTDDDSSSQKTLKKHYINSAKDNEYQDGIITLYLALNKFISGEGSSIIGPKHDSIFKLDATLCELKAIMALESLLFSMLLQMHYLYYPDEALKQWTKRIRDNQLKIMEQNCHE